MNDELEYAINRMATKINEVLFENTPSVYLYGSYVLDDFKIGWSDIDILVLTPKSIANEQSEILVSLRQALLKYEPQKSILPFFRGWNVVLRCFQAEGRR